VFALGAFGDRISEALETVRIEPDWAPLGLTYAVYNIVGAIVILPMVRHLTSTRDAAIAGLVAGPLAMLPALFFFVAMVAYYPEIASETLPSAFLLDRLGIPLFGLIFQFMVLVALLESSVGAVHAVNERIATAYRKRREAVLPRRIRVGATAILLAICMFVADRFGLVTLIAQGYRLLAYAFLIVFILPLLTVGLYRLSRRSNAGEHSACA
jgi:uncharacterized membrane protein YkvI